MTQANRISQQFAIAAAHVEQAIGDEAADLVLQGADLPVILRPAVKAEQRLGDDAIAGPGQLRVERAQHQDVSVAGLGREFAPPVTRWASGQRQPEAHRGHCAELEKRVQRQDDDEVSRAGWRRMCEPEPMLAV